MLASRYLITFIFMALGSVMLSHPVLASTEEEAFIASLSAIEKNLKARIGVAIKETQTGQTWQYRADELFPITSTFKVFACAAVLTKVDKNQEQLSRRLIIKHQDIVAYSPATESKQGQLGIALSQLCEVSITLSDNTAANLILKTIGGPEGLTLFFRRLGDPVSRLDRFEPALNHFIMGDKRDTTSPNAMIHNLNTLLYSDLLTSSSKTQLKTWMIEDKVADALLRASLPPDWLIGDKTGAGENGSRSIIAFIEPPQRAPILVTIYITDTKASMQASNAAIAEIGQMLVTYFKANKH